MVIFETSVIDDTKLFTLDGLPYAKGLFKIVYTDMEQTNSGLDLDKLKLRLDYIENDKPIMPSTLLSEIEIDGVVSTDITEVIAALNPLINFNGGGTTPSLDQDNIPTYYTLTLADLMNTYTWEDVPDALATYIANNGGVVTEKQNVYWKVTEPTRKLFYVSESSLVDACSASGVTNIPVYHDGAGDLPVVGDKIYQNNINNSIFTYDTYQCKMSLSNLTTDSLDPLTINYYPDADINVVVDSFCL